MVQTIVSTEIPLAHLDDYQEPPSQLQGEISGLVAVSIILLVTSWVTVSLRMYVRVFMVRSVGIDDWFMVLTLLLFSAYAIACCILSADLLSNLPAFAAGEIPTSLKLPNAIISAYTLYCASMLTFKISLGLFFLKIFAQSRGYRILLWASIIVPSLLGVLNIAWTVAFPCQVQSLFFVGLPSCPHTSRRTDWIVVGALWGFVSAVTDLLYAGLSYQAIRKLQMSRRDKIAAGFLCALGTVGGVASTVRLVFLVATFPRVSVLGEAIYTALWSVIEPGLGITAAAMASLRPLWRRVKEARTGYTSNYRTPGPTVATGGARPALEEARLMTDKSLIGGIRVEVELDQRDVRTDKDGYGDVDSV
ncbi:hypothetical protein CAC42_7280 [Sphaceloma murrayae]|uniref:Rhodopsin domain-containing protein n=1 Tax=Sphaceloma murrayae TaxID=2082308 RepID=A0A2K1QWK0_9PEZI|nr:hypothetical protein CAC42_7280 [Sphaceloma murrayae]